jgi:hypothetical protein
MEPMATITDHNLPRLFEDEPNADELTLQLRVTDRDCLTELLRYPAGATRDEAALAALRIGVLALRQASGQVDGELIQRETQRMLTGMETQLVTHAKQVQERLEGALKEYFDPTSGRLAERVQRLVAKDGELERVLRSHVGGQDSELVKTLLSHVGQQSPLMKLLSPSESQGLIASLREVLSDQLRQQSTRVLSEFTLDNKEGALSRLVTELSQRHGELAKALQDKIDDVVQEFSLDQEDSALSRLVRNMEGAQKTISSEFSLDNGESAFSRLRKELFEVLERNTKHNQVFQEEVKVALGRLVARREEAQKSTRHGLEFEDGVCAFLETQIPPRGDIVTRTGATTGLIRNSKVGDAVIELGPDSIAAGGKIVVEAKEKQGYTLKEAREELELARKNRDCQVGLFVFSRRSAPPGLEEVQRLGEDVFVVWDAEDAGSDLYLKVAITLARALCCKASQQNAAQSADFESITAAILEIERQARFLTEVTTSGETIKNSADKILSRVKSARESLEKQVQILQERVQELRGTLAVDAT